MTYRLAAFTLIFAVLALTTGGCGSGQDKLVPVSGRVTINGKKPPARLHVQFQPIGSKGKPNPGRGAYGTTDNEGHFTLQTDGNKGAVAGKHIVRIFTVLKSEATTDLNPEGASPDGAVPPAGPGADKEIIPAEYGNDSTMQFEVPAGGTDQANIDLKIPDLKIP